jgi:mono/diheme cytochrome c family protein
LRSFRVGRPNASVDPNNPVKELKMRTRLLLTAVFSLTAAGVLSGQSRPTIKKVVLTETSATSGQEMFAAYCAACHGIRGKGDGPAAVALKKQPPDLTRLAATNGGKYPDYRVTETLEAKEIFAHGSQEMPVWGALFKSISHGDRDLVRMRLVNLTSYIKTIQE